MDHTTHTDVQRQTASKGGDSPSKRGKLLFAVGTDRGRVGLEILIRAAVSAFVMGLTYFRGNTLAAPVLAIFALFSAWSLLHMGDKMELYQNGILHVGKWYPIGAGARVTWVGGRGFFLPTTHLDVSGCPDRINVSFMKDAQKLFNRAYNGAIYWMD